MGQLDFTLRIHFAFLCFFVEDDKSVTVLLRELKKPQKARPPKPTQAHYPILRYDKASRIKEDSGDVKKGNFIPPNGLPFGTANALVAFDNEDLEILPAGKPMKPGKLTKDLTHVFDTSLLHVADSTLPTTFFQVDRRLASSQPLDPALAARIQLSEGSLFIDEEAGALTPGKFSIFPLFADFTDKSQAHLQEGFRISRVVVWELKVRPESEKERYVDFKFRKGDQVSCLRLAPPPQPDSILEVHIRNCEEEEIDNPNLPTRYEDQIHRGELMACYPLLQGFSQNPAGLPRVKLAPYATNGSGVCAPVKSK